MTHLSLLLPPNTPIYSFSLSNSCPFVVNCCYLHICICAYIDLPKCIKYNLLSLCNVNCKYVFRADPLVLHSQFGGTYGRLLNPTLSIP